MRVLVNISFILHALGIDVGEEVLKKSKDFRITKYALQSSP